MAGSGGNLDPGYADFLAAKTPLATLRGIAPSPMPAHLFDYQAAAVSTCLRLGCAALFLDTGLGKTACELEFARQATDHTGMPSLILTPLAVARQIEAEGNRFGYSIRVVRDQSEVRPGINVCNYDRLDKLDARAFGCVVLDESSVLKNFTGRTTRELIEMFATTPFRLAATATPAPNDHMEIGTHAEFLGVMAHHEMLVRWFINDTNDTGVWRLKGHAMVSFWDWCASWAIMAETPEDLGFDGSRHILPALNVHRHKVAGTVVKPLDALFAEDVSATTMFAVKRQTSRERAASAAAIVAESDEPCVVWCDTNDEADHLLAAIPNAAEVRGNMTIDAKERVLADFVGGRLMTLIGKPSMLGQGLNLQFCSRMIFVGRSFSYEAWYQAVRRCWRFGQTQPVNVHLMVAEGEDQIGRVIDRKAADHARMKASMRAATLRARGKSHSVKTPYLPMFTMEMPSWLSA